MKLINQSNVTNWLIIKGFANEEEKEIIEYGLYQGFLMLINILTTFFLGFIFNVFWQSIIFLISYMLLRTYAGGYHANTKNRCYILSVVIMIICFFLINNFELTMKFGVLLSAISGILIFTLAPVANDVKPLEEVEVKIYKNKARKIFVIEFAIAIIAEMLGKNGIFDTIVLSISTTSILLALGYLKYNVLLNVSQLNTKE
ncbi:accessory gene regulator ArgB-like protein [Clostridium ihumii]|uniref:accessory gene regulator ArgB-like protein n=1 Tax=Clostridium ihumii TaxID=1470356 RepID=UPI00058B2D72|nr:accessory gene regulator B family protein [Clostridium ihumii]